jgi:predicted RNA binding protein YcfA (HicA-like mRNA interferase family)
MKREDLLRHLRVNGCYLKREGGSHSLWVNSTTGAIQAVPRHNEIADMLAKSNCKRLGIAEAGRR